MIVFDFDGTLVLSNQLKYDAYFKLFPDDECHRMIITQVLEQIVEESRFVILEAIAKRAEEECSGNAVLDVEQLAERYNSIVLDGAKNCPVCCNAREVVETLTVSHSLYLSSNTPQKPLREIIEHRQWTPYFKGVFGYPKKKHQTLLDIMELEKAIPSQILVVGDGESDRNSATQVGCHFFHIAPPIDLKDVLNVALQ